MSVSHAAADASTAADTVSAPLCPTSSAENTIGVSIRRLVAVMPAAVPTATASVGETPNQISVSVASATPRKIAGNTGPPRKPHPKLIA